MKPDDKPKSIDSTFEEPKLYKMIDGKKFPLPALETAFVDFSYMSDKSEEVITGCSCNPVGTTVCSCNKVKVTCSCVGYTSCSCVSDTPSCSCVSNTSGGTRVTGCRCAPVH